jgi:hypothetical protein
VQTVAGSLQSLCWASQAVGAIASAYFSGSLVGSWGPRGIFALTAFFPLIVSLSAILIAETPIGSGGKSKEEDEELGMPGDAHPLPMK